MPCNEQSKPLDEENDGAEDHTKYNKWTNREGGNKGGIAQGVSAGAQDAAEEHWQQATIMKRKRGESIMDSKY